MRHLLSVADERGVDLRVTMRRAGVDPDAVQYADLRVSFRQGAQIVHEAVRLLDDPAVGLDVGARQFASSWRLVGLALLTADSLRAGIDIGLRFQLAAGAMVEWSHTRVPGGLALVASLPGGVPDLALERVLVDEAFASVVSVAGDALGSPLVPNRVCVRHGPARPADAERYRRAFGVTPRFGAPDNRVELVEEDLGRAARRRDPVVHAQVLALLQAERAHPSAQHELVHRLELAVTRSLPAVPTMAELAHAAGLSARSLRRRLTEIGTTYTEVVDSVRRAAAQRLLTGTDLPIEDVAIALGFADARTLRRAVHRWTGSSPSQLRTQPPDSAGPAATTP